MIKMMIVCVVGFALSWAPFNLLNVLGDRFQEVVWSFKYIHYVWFLCHWLAMSHSFFNPLIYIWMNLRFRAGFRYIFGFLLPGCCPKYGRDGIHPLPDFVPQHPTSLNQTLHSTIPRDNMLSETSQVGRTVSTSSHRQNNFDTVIVNQEVKEYN